MVRKVTFTVLLYDTKSDFFIKYRSVLTFRGSSKQQICSLGYGFNGLLIWHSYSQYWWRNMAQMARKVTFTIAKMTQKCIFLKKKNFFFSFAQFDPTARKTLKRPFRLCYHFFYNFRTPLDVSLRWPQNSTFTYVCMVKV